MSQWVLNPTGNIRVRFYSVRNCIIRFYSLTFAQYNPSRTGNLRHAFVGLIGKTINIGPGVQSKRT